MTNEEEEERRKRIQRLLDSEADTRAELPVDPQQEETDPSTDTTKAQTPKRTPTSPPQIQLDKDNMPLPRRVNETDLEGTRVTPVAYEPTSRPRNGVPATHRLPSQPPLNPPLQQPSQPAARPVASTSTWRPEYGGCLIRTIIVALFSVVILSLMGGTVLLFSYYSIARTLPSVEDLQTRASQFETTRILDRNGNLLYEILDPSAGRRTYVPLSQISPVLIGATIATEDKDFYSHPGLDPAAIIRAL